MTLKTPIFLENDTTTQSADELRLERMYMTGSVNGVFTTAHMKVTQRGAGANMSVDIAAGAAVIVGTESALQGSYHVTNDAAFNIAITAADLTNPRKDLVICRVRDTFYSGANNDAQFLVVAGTPAASPAEPNLVALGYKNYIVLALVDVPASDTSITDSQITDRRPRVSYQGGGIVCTSTTRPLSPVDGMEIYETDTGKSLTYMASKSDWFPPWHTAWGIIGISSNNSSNQVLTATGYSDLNIPSVNLRIDRHYEISVQCSIAISAAGAGWGISFHLNTTQLNSAQQCDSTTHGSFGVPWFSSFPFKVGGTGLFQLRVHATEQSGTANCTFVGTATAPRTMWLKDIGPAI